ncbi:hypothetical protein B0O44_102525 [Pedobacter nutrimenti]|jgi:hypothetical protein|uniref:Uncharacterized protein n=1 Tax=Pedobacter nutrimenti TaxID=1241337 RepID=A0A318UWE0_9SPHI|nr:hypothetical protein B0O44_102525 [Pedobacter nutrimenti]
MFMSFWKIINKIIDFMFLLLNRYVEPSEKNVQTVETFFNFRCLNYKF